jgi:hypothetical protein
LFRRTKVPRSSGAASSLRRRRRPRTRFHGEICRPHASPAAVPLTPLWTRAPHIVQLWSVAVRQSPAEFLAKDQYMHPRLSPSSGPTRSRDAEVGRAKGGYEAAMWNKRAKKGRGPYRLVAIASIRGTHHFSRFSAKADIHPDGGETALFRTHPRVRNLTNATLSLQWPCIR